MAKDYFIKFVPKAWRAEDGIRCATLEARGLWIEMLCLMFESPRRGYLLGKNGLPPTAEKLALLVNSSPEVVSRCLAELETDCVFSRDAQGIIYSRRMLEEERLRNTNSEKGRMGGRPPKSQTESRTESQMKAERKPDIKPDESLIVRSKKLEVRDQTSDADDDPNPKDIPELDDLPWFSWALLNNRQRNDLLQAAKVRGGPAVKAAYETAYAECDIQNIRSWTSYALEILSKPPKKPKHEQRQESLLQTLRENLKETA